MSSAELLDAWERGSLRTIALLAAACPESSVDAVTGLSIGVRDRWLLQLRAWRVGPQVLRSRMSACREGVEWAIDATSILERSDGAADGSICRSRLCEIVAHV